MCDWYYIDPLNDTSEYSIWEIGLQISEYWKALSWWDRNKYNPFLNLFFIEK